MSILGAIEKQDFIENYWQKKSLLVREACTDFSHTLSAEELAGLAMEDEVESRFVIHEPKDNHWQLQHGPFVDEDFTQLPESHWSLLVQAVDHWFPEVGEILQRFDFLPSWRLEDVMVSYATEGGGVGPHFDYYDVFLLQVSGRRRWRLGQQCDENSAVLEGQPLRLLQNFEERADHSLGPGDMLYVPAGLSHWGTSEDDECMTWSIGFRAPSAAELLIGAIEKVAEGLPQHLRYRDGVDLRAGAEMGYSVDASLEELFSSLDKNALMSAIKSTFKSQVTEPLRQELVEPLEDDVVDLLMDDAQAGRVEIVRAPGSRFTYRQLSSGSTSDSLENDTELYVDGDCYLTQYAAARMISELEITVDKLSSPMIRLLLKAGALIAV